jgi:hypothetical protein
LEAFLANVALEAEVVVTLRKARMSLARLSSWVSRFAHRSSDRQRRDSDARSQERATSDARNLMPDCASNHY